MPKPSRYKSPAAALIKFLQDKEVPHSCRYIFPEETLVAAQIVFEIGNEWLATIDYRKPWDTQVSASSHLNFTFQYENPNAPA